MTAKKVESNVLMVMNLPDSLTDDHVRELLSPFGQLKKFNLLKVCYIPMFCTVRLSLGGGGGARGGACCLHVLQEVFFRVHLGEVFPSMPYRGPTLCKYCS